MKKIYLLMLVAVLTTACSSPADKANDVNVAGQQEVQEKVLDKNTAKEDVVKDKKEEGETKIQGENKITNINDEDVLTSPIMIEGETGAEKGKLMVALTNQDKEIKVEAFAIITENEDGPSTFRSNLYFAFSGTKEGYVMIYEKDGEEKINVIDVPVKFGPIE
jgi:hypothetical protein